MVLLEDTRNKVGKHRNVASYCAKNGIDLVRQKLDVGDYMFPGGKIVIDTKENLSEVATNLMNRNDAARFWREVRAAQASGLKLIVLVEHGGLIKTINDVPKWKNKYGMVTGRRLVDEMVRLDLSYGVRWVFCDKRTTGRRIIELLSEELT